MTHIGHMDMHKLYCLYHIILHYLTPDDLQAGTAAAIAAVCSGHKENQDAVMVEGAAK